MERVLCLRIFVLVTIFTATNWDQSVTTLAKWIRVASITRVDFGDNLGFFSIVSALGRIAKKLSSRHTSLKVENFSAFPLLSLKMSQSRRQLDSPTSIRIHNSVKFTALDGDKCVNLSATENCPA